MFYTKLTVFYPHDLSQIVLPLVQLIFLNLNAVYHILLHVSFILSLIFQNHLIFYYFLLNSQTKGDLESILG